MEFKFEYCIQIGDAQCGHIECIAEIEADHSNGHGDDDWKVDGIKVNLSRWGSDGRVQHVDVDLPASHPMFPVIKTHVETTISEDVAASWSAHIANQVRSYSEAAE